MRARSLLRAALLLFTSGSFAEAPPEQTPITLRALLDMLDEPKAVAEALAFSTGKYLTEEEKAGAALILPPQVFTGWIQAAMALQKGAAPDDIEEVFPPALQEILKDGADLPVKRAHLELSLGRLRQLAEKHAEPGESAVTRKIHVPVKWLESFSKVRDEFARQTSDALTAAARGENNVARLNSGTYVRNEAGNMVKVANAEVQEEGAIFCAPYGRNGTWNLYQVVNRPSTWLQADRQAREMQAPLGDKKIPGHLVSIHSHAENHFVLNLLRGIPLGWIGLNDRRLEADRDPLGTWEWSSGEPVTFRKFQSGEPNSASHEKVSPEEDGVLMWTANKIGHFGHWGDFSDGSLSGRNGRYPFVVEWSVESPGPIKGAELAQSFWAQEIDGPPAEDGAFGTRIVYSGGGCVSFRSALIAYTSGKGRIVETKLPVLHHREPDRADYCVLFADAQPFPEQKDKHLDRDMVIFSRGKIRVTEPGTYTFGVSHDDGFALRIKGQRWLEASGHAIINSGDPSSLEWGWPAQHGRSLATIDLPAGDHEIEFFGFQGDGEGYFELFSAKGAFTSVDQTSTWRLVGHQTNAAGGDIGLPGIAAPGWSVDVTAPNTLTRTGYDGVLAALERHGQKVEQPQAIIDYIDPEQGWDFTLHSAQPFPLGVPGKADDNFAFRARGTLKIPKDGLYWLGYHTARGGRLAIPGQKWKRLALCGPAKATIDEEILENEPNAGWGCRVIGEIELKAGSYPIEFLGSFGSGHAAVEIVGSHAGGPSVHLRSGAAKTIRDVPGFQLVK